MYSISCPVGQNFLGKYVPRTEFPRKICPTDRISLERTHFPPTPGQILIRPDQKLLPDLVLGPKTAVRCGQGRLKLSISGRAQQDT